MRPPSARRAKTTDRSPGVRTAFGLFRPKSPRNQATSRANQARIRARSPGRSGRIHDASGRRRAERTSSTRPSSIFDQSSPRARRRRSSAFASSAASSASVLRRNVSSSVDPAVVLPDEPLDLRRDA